MYGVRLVPAVESLVGATVSAAFAALLLRAAQVPAEQTWLVLQSVSFLHDAAEAGVATNSVAIDITNATSFPFIRLSLSARGVRPAVPPIDQLPRVFILSAGISPAVRISTPARQLRDGLVDLVVGTTRGLCGIAPSPQRALAPAVHRRVGIRAEVRAPASAEIRA